MDLRFAQDTKDCESVSEIFAVSWRAAYRNIFRDEALLTVRPERWKTRLSDMVRTRSFSIIIVNDGQRDVGAGIFGWSRDKKEKNWGEIIALYVLPDAWGKGMGRALMALMLSELTQMNCVRTHLWVIRDNARACRFYEASGFERSETEDYMELEGDRIAIVEYVK